MEVGVSMACSRKVNGGAPLGGAPLGGAPLGGAPFCSAPLGSIFFSFHPGPRPQNGAIHTQRRSFPPPGKGIPVTPRGVYSKSRQVYSED